MTEGGYNPFAQQEAQAAQAAQMQAYAAQQAQMQAAAGYAQPALGGNRGIAGGYNDHVILTDPATGKQHDCGRVTGGSVAKSMQVNPYLNQSNMRFRKPTHAEIITEIQIHSGLTGRSDVVRIEDDPAYTRHVCTVSPYFTYLTRAEYDVSMPEYDIRVGYFVHPACGKMIICSSGLSG